MPFAEAAAAASLIDFSILRMHECVKILNCIKDARGFATQADVLRNRFLLARAAIVSWLDETVRAQKDPSSPIHGLDWNIVLDTVGQLEGLLKDANGLEKQYGMVLNSDDTQLFGKGDDKKARGSNFLTRALDAMKPKVELATSGKLQNSATPWQQLKWGFSGKTKFQRLIEAIERYVQVLQGTVNARSINYLVGTQKLMLDIIVAAVSPKDTEAVRDSLNEVLTQKDDKGDYYRSAAVISRLRARHIDLGVDLTQRELDQTIPNSVSTNVKLPRSLKLKGLEIQKVRSLGPDRALATYGGNRVLLEYKRVTPLLRDKLRHRIQALGLLLKDADSSLLSTLPLEGICDDHTFDRYVFVFQVPPAVNKLDAEQITTFTLMECFDESKAIAPPITARTLMILGIAQALKNLHASGWLRKSLRSDNLMFFTPNPVPISVEGAYGPFLLGFDYARAANPTEFSESLPTNSNRDLYCHRAVMVPNPRAFRKYFDLYALGICMLEILLRQPLYAIINDHLASQDHPVPTDTLGQIPMRDRIFERTGEGSVMYTLSSTCPAACVEAIQRCLANRPEESWDDTELSLEDHDFVIDRMLISAG